MIKAVIFDHDGVIADMEPLHARADNLVLARYGAHFPDDKMAGLIGVSTLKSWELFKELFKIPEAAECLVFEDSNPGITAAKAAGMACIALRTSSTASHDISMADKVVGSLSEIRVEDLVQSSENNKNLRVGGKE